MATITASDSVLTADGGGSPLPFHSQNRTQSAQDVVQQWNLTGHRAAACSREGLRCLSWRGKGDLVSGTGRLPVRVLCGQAAGSWLPAVHRVNPA